MTDPALVEPQTGRLRKNRPSTCGYCGMLGHTAKRCQKRVSDGLARYYPEQPKTVLVNGHPTLVPSPQKLMTEAEMDVNGVFVPEGAGLPSAVRPTRKRGGS